jgi:hypothetical protein
MATDRTPLDGADLDGVQVTLDIDWAPDFMIDYAAGVLTERAVRATWFVTHASPAVARLAESPIFELGLHPNFLPGSSHGDSWEAVLAHCAGLVPGGRCMRTHSLAQSTPLLDHVAATTAVGVDASLYLPHAPGLRPVEHWSAGGSLVRIPYVWEDDLEMARPRPAWSLAELPDAPGVKVLDFHPVHVFLNSAELGPYEELKRQPTPLPDLDEAAAAPFANRDGVGTRDMFLQAVDHVAAHGGGATIGQIADAWRERSRPE